MKKNFIFFDVDGTLLSSQYEVLPSTILALRAMEAKGIKYAIASGRNVEGILPIIKANNLTCSIIAGNGSIVLDEDGKKVFSAGMSKAEAQKIVKMVDTLNLDVVLNFYTNEGWTVLDDKHPVVIREEKLTSQKAKVKRLEDLEQNENCVFKINYVASGEVIEHLLTYLRMNFPDYAILRTSTNWLEINKIGMNKGVGARALLDYFGYDSKASIAFGDSYNDIELLKFVGLGIAMGNAFSDVQAVADYITEDNDNDGIFLALKRFEII